MSKIMTVGEVNDYVMSKGILLPTKQVFLTEPLYVFKKAYTYKDAYSPGINSNSKRVLERSLNESIKLCSAIINLIIPKGAIVNLCNNGLLEGFTQPGFTYRNTYCTNKKLRADKAICWNIIRVSDEVEVKAARSWYDNNFTYYPCKNKVHKNTPLDEVADYAGRVSKDTSIYLRPSKVFDMTTSECESGIHFFLEPKSALNFM